MVSYYCPIAALSPKCTVFEIFVFEKYCDLKPQLGVTQGYQKWH